MFAIRCTASAHMNSPRVSWAVRKVLVQLQPSDIQEEGWSLVGNATVTDSVLPRAKPQDSREGRLRKTRDLLSEGLRLRQLRSLDHGRLSEADGCSVFRTSLFG